MQLPVYVPRLIKCALKITTDRQQTKPASMDHVVQNIITHLNAENHRTNKSITRTPMVQVQVTVTCTCFTSLAVNVLCYQS